MPRRKTTLMKQFQESALFTRASAILGISCYAITALIAACSGDGAMGYMAPSIPMAAPPPAASIMLNVTTTVMGASGTLTAAMTDARLRTVQRDET
jgi:hypothetical protein